MQHYGKDVAQLVLLEQIKVSEHQNLNRSQPPSSSLYWKQSVHPVDLLEVPTRMRIIQFSVVIKPQTFTRNKNIIQGGLGLFSRSGENHYSVWLRKFRFFTLFIVANVFFLSASKFLFPLEYTFLFLHLTIYIRQSSLTGFFRDLTSIDIGPR